MNETEKQEPDLIDRIANALPPETRATYYKEMRHCRNLPENDEMLRVIRAMMMLTALTEQVPRRILAEREQLGRICREVIETAQRLETTGGRYCQNLDQRLAKLPEAIARGISPEAIVSCINDSLRRQFNQSTIPTVARELAASAETIKTATAEYRRATDDVSDSYRSASEKAHQAIGNIDSAVTRAANRAREAVAELSVSFGKTYRWAVVVIFILGFSSGVASGISAYRYFYPAEKIVYAIPPELRQLLQQYVKPSPRKGK